MCMCADCRYEHVQERAINLNLSTFSIPIIPNQHLWTIYMYIWFIRLTSSGHTRMLQSMSTAPNFICAYIKTFSDHVPSAPIREQCLEWRPSHSITLRRFRYGFGFLVFAAQLPEPLSQPLWKIVLPTSWHEASARLPSCHRQKNCSLTGVACLNTIIQWQVRDK